MNTAAFVRSGLGMLVAIGMLTGCSSNNDSNPLRPSAPAGQGLVKVVHASPDAPAVDLLVDNALVRSNLAFAASTGYLPVNEGTRNVKINVTGTSTTVIDAGLPVSADGAYTVFAVDSVANISAVVLTDDLTAPAAGNAHVRFVHLSPNAPAVDVGVTGGGVVFANRSFKQSTPFSPLPAGTYNLEVRLAGTGTVVLPLPGVTLEAGKIYTVFAKGFVGGVGSQALGAGILVNNVAQVMVVHASPDAPGVDLLVDGTLAGANLTFPNNTGYLDVNAGTRNVKVNVAGTATTVIEADLPVWPSGNYSVFAVDSVATLSALVLTDDLTPPAPGFAHVRFVHLSPNAPAVDVAVQNGAVVFANRSFKQSTDFLPLAAGTYNLEVRAAGTLTAVLPLPGVTLEAGRIYTVFARGFLGGSANQALNAAIILNN